MNREIQINNLEAMCELMCGDMEDDYYDYYFKYISGIIAEGQKVTLELIDKPGIQITRVLHDERENGLYITYKGVRYYEAYHIEF